ncbi:MAG: 50S ribosomal protein L30 [Oligoflexales bacterium]|nr:50S ribosomal protein L30 [Oligoflexales bacterium]
MGKIKVTQVKSVISEPEKVRRIIAGLGLRKRGAVKVHQDNNCIRGMVNKVIHLVKYECIPG